MKKRDKRSLAAKGVESDSTLHKFLFVDTDIFEHFPPLTDIDWIALAGSRSVTLVVPSATIRDLNRHKDTSSKPRQKRRATEALRRLSEWAGATSPVTILPSVDLVFRSEEPLIDFSVYHLRHEVPDDELLASAIEFGIEKQLAADSVLVISADLGLTLKGRSQKTIGTLPMPESLRLPDEPDSEDKRVRELEERLQQLSSRLPKLKLTFWDGKNFDQRTHYRGGTLPVDETKIGERMKALRADYPYLADNPSPPPGWRFSTAGKEEREEYNKEMHKYYQRHERYIRDYLEATNWQVRTKSLVLALENSGSVPAEDISISLRFPQGIEIIKNSEFKALPRLPEPPELPGEERSSAFPNISLTTEAHETTSKPNAVITEITNSRAGFEVGLHVSRLKHTFSEQLPLLNVHFPAAKEIKSFHFTYQLVASNFPLPVEGELHVKIIVKDEADPRP